ncbi:YciI family protein [Luteimicrobium sp. DT211]|uniref:YciI family protein n=1 Tax=Luteimicrobium sp. DT211 TaxID=3393412 RepID=UPI003CED29C8
MRYAIMLHYPERSGDELGDALAEGQSAFQAYARDLDQAGVLVSGEVWQPSSATTTLTAADGTLRVQDGPFADTHDQLGGQFVVDVPDLDAALAWAEKAPSVWWGPVEVRPSATYVQSGTWVPTA